MLALGTCFALLILGYLFYGKLVDRVFGPDSNRATVAVSKPDGVDCVPMPTWKVFLIQLLNIAGIGPVFGPILGALYGPSALVWIVAGAIFAGGVHDYFSGMLSLRCEGASLPEVMGKFMGNSGRALMRVFSLLLLVLVGVVFVISPAELLASLTGINTRILVYAIFAYYFLATVTPIDKLIGRLYPVFGALLLFMTFSVLIGLLASGRRILPNLSIFENPHPAGAPVWPGLFIVLSCGAISGFHSTQSPIMARCMRSEKNGRLVFYGAMIAEAVIALIWAAVGMSFYETPSALNAVIAQGTPSLVVEQACKGLLGPVGAFLAILGVVVLPVTSGDTAFRAARLILAEVFRIDQARARKRLALAVPLFLIAFAISTCDFNIVWRYFGWSNQALASLMLWAAAIFLVQNGKPHWMASLPAAFMTAVAAAFILQSKIGFGLPGMLANMCGIAGGVLALCILEWKRRCRA